MVALIFLTAVILVAASEPISFHETLKALPFKIAYECYVDDNWEIFTMNPDGSGAVNLTRTPDQHEHYPQVSPDGTKICFSVDQGEGREAVRSLYVMDIDGGNPKKLVENAREPLESGQQGHWFPAARILEVQRDGFLH